MTRSTVSRKNLRNNNGVEFIIDGNMDGTVLQLKTFTTTCFLKVTLQ
ncbi:MAG: hypothetical protein R2727_08660 [Bacteroidales bacterium]